MEDKHVAVVVVVVVVVVVDVVANVRFQRGRNKEVQLIAENIQFRQKMGVSMDEYLLLDTYINFFFQNLWRKKHVKKMSERKCKMSKK